MQAKTVEFAVTEEDRLLLDRLVARYGHGNRSAFLREALHVMAARERAERFEGLQRQAHDEMGRVLFHDEAVVMTRRLVKGG